MNYNEAIEELKNMVEVGGTLEEADEIIIKLEALAKAYEKVSVSYFLSTMPRDDEPMDEEEYNATCAYRRGLAKQRANEYVDKFVECASCKLNYE